MRRFPENVQVWLSTEEKRALDAICTHARVARSTFMREAALRLMEMVRNGEVKVGMPGWCPRLSPEEQAVAGREGGAQP